MEAELEISFPLLIVMTLVVGFIGFGSCGFVSGRGSAEMNICKTECAKKDKVFIRYEAVDGCICAKDDE